MFGILVKVLLTEAVKVALIAAAGGIVGQVGAALVSNIDKINRKHEEVKKQ